ncbi:hypothetical protein ADK67_08105 [Saccharothrix sp. NRRL B-16348]|nr:hypothetical protein ADK67_08105 [Saccharothrix sp. NRRL B-16348]
MIERRPGESTHQWCDHYVIGLVRGRGLVRYVTATSCRSSGHSVMFLWFMVHDHPGVAPSAEF